VQVGGVGWRVIGTRDAVVALVELRWHKSANSQRPKNTIC
jgi:hypothetical protein